MAKERLIWADSLKGFLILLVVLGHAIQGVYTDNVESNRLWNVIYSFHMPAFFAISGYFVKPVGGGQKWLSKRVWQLLVPYLVWCLLKLLLTHEFSLDALTKIVTEPVSFWFLWVLFWVYLIFQLSLHIHKKSRSKFNYISIVFAFILIGAMALLNTKIFGFHLIAYYFSFYALGYYMEQHNWLNISSGCLLGGQAIVWLSLALGWSMHSLPSWMPAIPIVPVSMVQLAYRFITALVAIVVMLNVAPLLLNRNSKVNGVMSRLGFYSLGIYVTHYLVIWWIADLICKNAALSEPFEIIIIFMLGIAVSILLVWLLNRNKYTALVFLGKLMPKAK